jgi:hypothetical protein
MGTVEQRKFWHFIAVGTLTVALIVAVVVAGWQP